MENRKLAVLIDADNAQSALIAELLAEVAGTAPPWSSAPTAIGPPAN